MMTLSSPRPTQKVLESPTCLKCSHIQFDLSSELEAFLCVHSLVVKWTRFVMFFFFCFGFRLWRRADYFFILSATLLLVACDLKTSHVFQAEGRRCLFQCGGREGDVEVFFFSSSSSLGF